MRLLRPALVLAAVASFTLAGSAFAAGPNVTTFADPAKDNMSPTAAADITSITFTTKGSGKGKAYTPKSLAVTMALGAAPGSDGTTNYRVAFSINGCEYYMDATPGARVSDAFGYADCGSEPDATGDPGTSFGFSAQPMGSSLVFKAVIKDLPNKVKLGTTLDGLHAFTDAMEPTGFFGPAALGAEPVYDVAETTKTFKLG